MNLASPFPTASISQNFGDNAISYYKEGLGLKGHPGIDYQVPYGTTIQAAADSYCYAVLSKNNPNLMAYRAVCTIVDDYEVIYGHCSEIWASVGWYKSGDVLARVGNTGSVFANGVEVSEKEKLAGSPKGVHLHFQVRKVKKVPAVSQEIGKHYLNDGTSLYKTPDGFIYEVPDWDNGFNGCVDPKQFFDELTPVLQAEVKVLKQTKDPFVYKALLALIVSQTKKLLRID